MRFAQVRAAARLAVVKRFLAAAALTAAPMITSAQTADMYKDRIRTWSTISALPDAAFGEQYDLYKGELFFHQEDLRLSGLGFALGQRRQSLVSVTRHQFGTDCHAVRAVPRCGTVPNLYQQDEWWAHQHSHTAVKALFCLQCREFQISRRLTF